MSDETPPTLSVLLSDGIAEPVEEMVPDHRASKHNPFSGTFKKDDMPRQSRTPRDKVSEKTVPANKITVIEKSLPGVYEIVGASVCLFNVTVGTTIIENAEPCAKSLAEVARTNPKVANALLKLMEGGAWGGVAIAHAPIAFAIFSSVQQSRKREEPVKEPDPSGTVDPNIFKKFNRPETNGVKKS